jgi:YebC/PmpR family DNA-binding regulatory protein
MSFLLSVRIRKPESYAFFPFMASSVADCLLIRVPGWSMLRSGARGLVAIARRRKIRYNGFSVSLDTRGATRMSGHSKWATIKRKKGAADVRRGKIFSKLIREITMAAKEGGGDPDSNVRLKNAVDKARASNMPTDNIDRAIKRATGADADAAAWEEITYEGYGPGSVAILVEALTDNKNRTAADVRHIFNRSGGKLGGSGSVSYLFARKGLIQVLKQEVDEDRIYEAAIDAGAENVEDGGEVYDVYTAYTDFEIIKTAIKQRGIPIENSEIIMKPGNTIRIGGKEAQSMLKMVELLEDNDDVQNVWANFDIDEKEMEAYGG